jgi:hypothetical protein
MAVREDGSWVLHRPDGTVEPKTAIADMTSEQRAQFLAHAQAAQAQMAEWMAALEAAAPTAAAAPSTIVPAAAVTRPRRK